jgi:hypothetical protein
MKKIAIFAIFLIATIMTFGQLVPDQQFLAPARMKSLTTKFTRLIPAKTIVYVDVTPYVLDSTGYVGNTLSNMILKGTAVLQSGAVAASFVAVDSSCLHSTGTEYGYGTYYFPNSFYLGSKFLSTGDTMKPITNNTGFLGSPTKQVGSIYSHYCTGDWGAFTKVTGTYGKFGTDSVTTAVVSTTLKLPGGTTATKKSTNCVQFSHSIATGASDTLITYNVLPPSNLSGNIGAYGNTWSSLYTQFAFINTLHTSGDAYVNGSLSVGVTPSNAILVWGKSFLNNGIISILSSLPKAFDSTGTLTAAFMLGGVIKCNSASAVTMTTTTATLLASAIAALEPNGGSAVGEGTTFDLIIDNTGSASGAITLALDGSITVGTGVITGGNTLTVAVGQTGKFQFYFNSASAARCYRVF